MKSIKVKAIFKGQDGSCGYKHGQEYALTIWNQSKISNENIAIELSDNPDKNYCEYESIVSFLNNWDCVRHVN